ncbi:MAG: HIT family protein [Sciscionella sp.]
MRPALGAVLPVLLAAIFHLPSVDGRLPYAGHVLVCPKRHAADFAALAVEEGAAVATALGAGTRVLKQLGAVRVYLATVGHQVDHLHVHLLPRWPETPDDVPWHAVDEWRDARRATPAQAADIVAAMRSAKGPRIAAHERL